MNTHCRKPISVFHYLQSKADVELPDDHTRALHQKKGDWTCQQCGELNNGIITLSLDERGC